MEKNIYALTYCYEGNENCDTPYACAIAVSENIDKIREKMAECVKEDTRVDEENEWSDECNYVVEKYCGDYVILRHRKYINQYAHYSIQPVEII